MRLVALILGACLCAGPAVAAPDVLLKGAISGKDNGGYRDVPFKVPAGVTRITVTFSHTGGGQKTVIDLGLFDNERFRGWSGGDKTRFTLSETDATPSYLAGPLHAGTWHLILGIPPTSFSRAKARPRQMVRSPILRSRPVRTGIVAICIRTPRKATALATARAAGRSPARCSRRSKPPRRVGSISSRSATTTRSRSSTTNANCSPGSTSCF
jgi:hypothetical protein